MVLTINPGEIANSDKPWIYLAVVMILLVVGGVVYIGKYLINLDKNNREESKEREKASREHASKMADSLERIADTQVNISKDVHDLKGRLGRLEDYTYRKGGD